MKNLKTELLGTAITAEELHQATTKALGIIEGSLPEFTSAFKVDTSENDFFVPEKNISWTSGFWTGQIWMAYELTQDPKFLQAAEVQVVDFLHRIEEKRGVDHHDMGFLYSLSCVAAYKLTGSEDGKRAALLAADQLISRYQEHGEFIQAWGKMGADDNYRLIIDCLLNLPLLYWATEVSGKQHYAEIAKKHINTSLQVILREDHSTHHTYYFEKGTGKPLRGETNQGYNNDSAWARGQAWGIYGVALSYKYTKNEQYKKTFFQVADYFIKHLPNDLVPYWDLIFTDGSDEPRDSSAGAIAVCGMLEMCKYLEGEEQVYYRDVALKILHSLANNYAVTSIQESNGLLRHGVYGKSTPYNECLNSGVDECTTWGDYFYMEALIRLQKDWELYW